MRTFGLVTGSAAARGPAASRTRSQARERIAIPPGGPSDTIRLYRWRAQPPGYNSGRSILWDRFPNLSGQVRKPVPQGRAGAARVHGEGKRSLARFHVYPLRAPAKRQRPPEIEGGATIADRPFLP